MNAKPPLVLLVEDDADTATLYIAMLSAEGWLVVSCENGQKAREWCSNTQDPPQLMVLDVRLPDTNGVELCQELINALPGDYRPAVLMLSAHGDPRMPSRCRKAGARAFLDKLRDLDRFVDTAKLLLEEQAPLANS